MSAERELLDRAITTLICALAHDEALQSGEAGAEELAQLRGYWIADAEDIVSIADRCGLLETEHDEDE